MAITQARIIESMEQACSIVAPSEFIFAFLDAYGFSKSTISRLRKGDDTRNVATGNDIAVKKKIYFSPVSAGSDVEAVADKLKVSDVVAKNDIRFVIITDFTRVVAFDLAAEERLDVSMSELHKNYAFFLPLAGYEKAVMYTEHPADVKASEKMGDLFDLIRERNDLSKPEDIHALNVFLTRLLFCFYADDTGIFERDQLTNAIQAYTKEDGSDVDQFFTDLFAVLNLKSNAPERQSLPVHLQAFPYVNGGLFKVDEPIPEFGRKARRILIDCGSMNWSEINPDIFGSMFQAVIDENQRGNLGQHYTSVSNIMKVIQPLFLDKLYAELEKARKSERKLTELHVRIQQIKIFDPACGSGNFLIIAYKELRKLEMEIVRAMRELDPQSIHLPNLSLSNLYGIEIDDFACEIARLSLWLTEHQLNTQWEKEFGYAPPALPLRDSGKIHHENSLQVDWHTVCAKKAEDEVYLIGNPPFLGFVGRTDEQREDMATVFKGKKIGAMDYVACWFWKGAQYIASSKAEMALVSTNSICQGEQVANLWEPIFNLDVNIHLAYTTFPWSNNARDKAAVHVIIVGLSATSNGGKLFQLSDGKLHVKSVSGISPYLVEGGNNIVHPSTKPLNTDIPQMLFGNMAADGGNLLLNRDEMEKLVTIEPGTKKWIKKILGAAEFLNGKERWCLWLKDATEEDLNNMPALKQRTMAVRQLRIKAGHAAALKTADTPHIFMQVSQPESGHYILVPRVSSERRDYVPIGFLDHDVICSDANLFIPNGSLFQFGIMTSMMHNDWMRLVGGRLESRYRYAASVVYNTFPWPVASDEKIKKIEALAEEILMIREDFPSETLSTLYDPKKMPETLREAHKALDRAVEKLYREKPFKDAAERQSHLIACYESLVNEGAT